MFIRPFQFSDIAALHAINQASTPGVSAETEGSLLHWIALSKALVACNEADSPLGFLTLIELGTRAYESTNLRWLEAWQAEHGGNMIYVDRIAVSEMARGKRVGEALYQEAFTQFGDRTGIGCEVNIRPPNPGSERFHRRLGFRSIGERTFENGEKAVGYWLRPLAGEATGSDR